MIAGSCLKAKRDLGLDRGSFYILKDNMTSERKNKYISPPVEHGVDVRLRVENTEESLASVSAKIIKMFLKARPLGALRYCPNFLKGQCHENCFQTETVGT